jgi:lipase
MARLHLHEWGDPAGKPVVCLHGIGGHGGRFRRLAEERLRTRRVLAPDLRGHGYSDWDPPWRLESHVDDVLETLATAGAQRPDWIGHSFGGRLVIEAAAAAPNRVERAILLDPAVWVPPPIALERAEQARMDVSFASPEEAIESWLATGRLYSTPRELVAEEAAAHLERSDDRRFRYRVCPSAVVAAFSEMARTPPLEQVRARTLLVRGEQTDVVPEAGVDVVRSELGADLEVVTVPGGHTVLWDAFDQTADAIARFLENPGA